MIRVRARCYLLRCTGTSLRPQAVYTQCAEVLQQFVRAERAGIHHASAGLPLERSLICSMRKSVAVVERQAKPSSGSASWGQSYITLSLCHILPVKVCFSLFGFGIFLSLLLSNIPFSPFVFLFFYLALIQLLLSFCLFDHAGNRKHCNTFSHTHRPRHSSRVLLQLNVSSWTPTPSKQLLNVLQNTALCYITERPHSFTPSLKTHVFLICSPFFFFL